MLLVFHISRERQRQILTRKNRKKCHKERRFSLYCWGSKMGTNFGMLRHDTHTKYVSRHATSNVTDALLYGNNTTLLDEKKPLLGQDNVMPCLKPTKGGNVVLRNDAQRELRYTSTACTDSWKRQLSDELMFTLSLTLSQMLLNKCYAYQTCKYTTKLKKSQAKFSTPSKVLTRSNVNDKHQCYGKLRIT